MIRDLFERLATQYPRAPKRGDPAFSGSTIRTLIASDIPAALLKAINPPSFYKIKGSVGQGDWTQTPWVVLLDPAVTMSVEEGVYPVYLLSHGCERLYLTINQGCTTLKNADGIKAARATLKLRANLMRSKVMHDAKRLGPIQMDLNVKQSIWRGRLYEAGCVLGTVYDARKLPSDDEMAADLLEAVSLHRAIFQEGGWAQNDEIMKEAASDLGFKPSLVQAKRYRQHRSIERHAHHSFAVKRAQGTRCKGCDFEMSSIYGQAGIGLIDAHHLRPLASLADGETVTFDPVDDFAVLCPNCHRLIHRLAEVGDLLELRKLVAAGALGPANQPGLRRP